MTKSKRNQKTDTSSIGDPLISTEDYIPSKNKKSKWENVDFYMIEEYLLQEDLVITEAISEFETYITVENSEVVGLSCLKQISGGVHSFDSMIRTLIEYFPKIHTIKLQVFGATPDILKSWALEYLYFSQQKDTKHAPLPPSSIKILKLFLKVSLPSNYFEGLENLERLSIIQQNQSNIPISLAKTTLKHLRLTIENLTEFKNIPRRALSQLKTLSLSSMDITTIGKIDLSLPNLESLELRNTNKKKIDLQTITKSTKYLNVKELKLEGVQDKNTISNLKIPNLTKLSFTNSEIPLNFTLLKKFTYLETLHIFRCEINQIDISDLDKLSNLKELKYSEKFRSYMQPKEVNKSNAEIFLDEIGHLSNVLETTSGLGKLPWKPKKLPERQLPANILICYLLGVDKNLLLFIAKLLARYHRDTLVNYFLDNFDTLTPNTYDPDNQRSWENKNHYRDPYSMIKHNPFGGIVIPTSRGRRGSMNALRKYLSIFVPEFKIQDPRYVSIFNNLESWILNRGLPDLRKLFVLFFNEKDFIQISKENREIFNTVMKWLKELGNKLKHPNLSKTFNTFT